MTPGPTPEDERLMGAALALARRNLGRTAPNPCVGALLVRPGPAGPVVIARGVTAPGGRPHAERVALDAAGEAARGATLYVTLEPCSHHGRTPPCADAVVAAGLARVVVGCGDPDPRVAGRGLARLRAAGVEVVEGCRGEEARRLALGHALRVTEGRPLVVLKLARTADGFAGTAEGGPLAVTGAPAAAFAHRLRSLHDAILVGIGTALADDPLLTCRLPGLARRSPRRVVLDRELRLPPGSRLARGAREVPLLLLAGAGADPVREAALVARGAAVRRLPPGDDGPRAALAALAAGGVTRLMLEGGPRLAEAFAAEGLLDEVVLLTAPAALGRPGLPALGPALRAWLAAATCAEAGALGADRLERFALPLP